MIIENIEITFAIINLRIKIHKRLLSGGDMTIFGLTHRPFSRGLLKNTHKLIVKISMDILIITQKLLKNYSKSRRWQVPGAVKKIRKKSPIAKKSERSCQCLYMFLTTQRKKPNLRRRLNHVFINQIVCNFYCSFIYDILEGCKNFKEIQ